MPSPGDAFLPQIFTVSCSVAGCSARSQVLKVTNTGQVGPPFLRDAEVAVLDKKQPPSTQSGFHPGPKEAHLLTLSSEDCRGQNILGVVVRTSSKGPPADWTQPTCPTFLCVWPYRCHRQGSFGSLRAAQGPRELQRGAAPVPVRLILLPSICILHLPPPYSEATG